MAAFAFGSFVLDVSERRVTHAGHPLALSGKTFDVLRVLVEARGRLVGREAFAARLWGGATVEERNLTVHISALRKVLMSADPSVDPVETVARVGYRLALPVHDVAPAGLHDGRPLWDVASLLHQAHEQLDQEERVAALRALTLFERVLALDPDNAAAHAGLAGTYLLLSLTKISRPLPAKDALQLARESAERALAIDGRQAEAWTVLGLLKMYYAWDWAGADEDLAQAVAIGPRSADAHEARGWFLSAVGRHDEAIKAFTVASELAPRRRRTWELLGFGRWMAGDGAGALVALEAAAALEPMARRPHARLMFVLDQLGRHDEAMTERITWVRLLDEAPLAARLDELHRAGRHRAAMVEFIAFLGRIDQNFEVALSSMAIDEHTAALEGLQRCVDTRNEFAAHAGAFPSFRPLVGDPRYGTILRTLGLPHFFSANDPAPMAT